MRTVFAALLALILSCLLMVPPVLAQASPRGASSRPAPPDAPQDAKSATVVREAPAARAGTPERNYDVMLDVPNLTVEQITLEVENLKALLSLDARIANIVSVKAGADVSIEKVKLDIKGVEAQAFLRVSLDNVVRIVNRTLESLDRNPQLIEMIDKAMQAGAATAGAGSDGAAVLLSRSVSESGRITQRFVDAAGTIVEQVVDGSGKTVRTTKVGALQDLPLVKQFANDRGQSVRQVRDAGSGQLIEYTVDNGKPVNVKLLK